MTDDRHADDLVGPYVMAACPPDEARSVADHASRCPKCAAEIAELGRVVEWIGVAAARAPAPELRARVLAAAIAARPAGDAYEDGEAHESSEARRLGELYHGQVADLDRLLSGLSQPQWLLPSGPHRSVRDLIVHLHGSDGLVAAVAGIDAPVDRRASGSDDQLRWRRQAGAIIDVVTRRGARLLDRPVRLAGRAAIRRPLREALVQRGFETWIHAEDVRAALDLPPRTPAGEQLADIVEFALPLLPLAMETAGRGRPGQAIRLLLTGSGGGTRTVDLSPVAGAVVAEIAMSAQQFCRLLAGRLHPPFTDVRIDGDIGAVDDFLTVAATMGCD